MYLFSPVAGAGAFPSAGIQLYPVLERVYLCPGLFVFD